MEQAQINKVIESKEFGLKDFNKSFRKWSEYKPDKVNEFFTDYQEEIKTYFEEDLYFIVMNGLQNKISNFNWLHLFETKMTKDKINRLMTIINDITYGENSNFMERLGYNLLRNKSEIKGFTIILYLRNYEIINRIMKEVLKDYLKDYNKKTILKNL